MLDSRTLKQYIRPVIFAGVDIGNPTVLAPLAGWSDAPYRKLCKSFGAGLLYTEMVSADGLIRYQKKTLDLARFGDDERPVNVQIFGAEADTVAQAVRIVSEMQPDFIDLNVGCPAKKVTRRGAGAALMRDLDQLTEIARAAVNATSIPVTAKLRSGWDSNVVVDAAQRLESVGISALAVHPRTQTMQFRGKADWRQIADVHQAVRIPVIGNGDIRSPEDAQNMMEQTGCDAVMLGRSAMGNPWIFRSVGEYLKSGARLPAPTAQERIRVCLQHLGLAAAHYGRSRTVKLMRKQIAAYIRGVDNASTLRRTIFNLKTLDQVIDVLQQELFALQEQTENQLQPI